MLNNKHESIGLKHCVDPKDIDDIYENINELNPNKDGKILIVFHYINADMLSHEKLQPIVIKLLIKVRKINISFVFITESYFAEP